MAELVITVEQRDQVGKNESRRLRKKGILPAILYGEKKDPVTLALDAKVVDRILHSKTGINTVFELALAGTDRKRAVMIKDYQLDPLTDRLIHCDLLRIDATHEVHVPVHVEFVGVAEGVKNEGGLLEFVTRELMVACLPKDIPVSIPVDVTALHVGQVIRVSDVTLPAGVRALTDMATVVFACHVPKAEAAPTPLSAATAEAAAAAGSAAAAPAGDAKSDAKGDADKKKKAEAPKKDKK
jgi:large subunit ribosomal protein L25